MSSYGAKASNIYGIDKAWGGPKIKDIPTSSYIFNTNKKPKAFHEILSDLLRICYIDSSILTYKLQFQCNTIVDIRLLSNGYSEPNLTFIENINSPKSAYVSRHDLILLEFLQFFSNLNKSTQKSLLNKILKTDYNNSLYSYQINNNSIIFI